MLLLLRSALAASIGILCAPAPAAAEDPERAPFVLLHVIPLSADPGALEGNGPLRLALKTAQPAELAAAQPAGTVEAVRSGEIVVQLPVAPRAVQQGEPAEWTEASFVVDFDEPDVEALRQTGRERFGEQPTPDDWITFTQDHIEAGPVEDFAVASQVARRGRGDCTEHAVLFAALARGEGTPTRVVSGLVVAAIDGSDDLGAFGHAWTEFHDGRRWVHRDPTDIQGGTPLGYVPYGIQDEGPGYTLSLIAAMNRGVTEVRVLAPPAGPAPEAQPSQ